MRREIITYLFGYTMFFAMAVISALRVRFFLPLFSFFY